MQLSKVEIPKNSNLKIIDECPFSDTDITQIYIPSNLIELKDGWCFCMHKLITINVSESNNRFLFIDDQYLIGKSNEQNENFDILLFARRDIKKAKIPKNIKIISPYAFADCCKLSKIEIQVNSSLKTIGQNSFENAGITQIFIPSNVSKICQFAFYKCCQLSKVEIAKSIKIISSHAFADCDKLSKVEIPANSNLETIGECAFKLTAITQIYIPSSVSTICEDAFEFCPKLQILEI